MSGSLPPFFHLLRFERIDSTNDEAIRRAEAGAAEGTLVVAAEQSAGRGRRGRAWISPPGNLYCSLLLRPACAVAEAAQLGFAASLAVAESASLLLPPDARVTCKWPNDVLLDGKKFAGILLQSRASGAAIDWLVLGIGVNIGSHPRDTEYPATSLALAPSPTLPGCAGEGATSPPLRSGGGRDPRSAREGGGLTPDKFLPILGERLLAWHEAWRGGFATLRTAWLARAEGLGGPIRVRLPDSELEGRFAGLDEAGRLVLDGPHGPRSIAAAEIFPAARAFEE